MAKNNELKELTEKSSLVFKIIAFTVVISAVILIVAKLNASNQIIPVETDSLTFSSDSFPTIQLGHYALWEVDPDQTPKLIKRFNSVENRLVSLDGSVLENLDYTLDVNTTGLLVTIEKEGDRDEIPNNFELFTGELSRPQTELVFDKVDFSQAGFSFILSTPTDGNRTINELSGIWFTDESGEQAGLNLPDLSDSKWSYEARVINGDTELLTGRFKTTAGPDLSQEFSLTNTGYNFPGEDYLNNLPSNLTPPLNLANGNYEVILSLEPDEANQDLTGEEVFLTIATKKIPLDAKQLTPITMDYIFKPISLTITINDNN